MSTVAIRAQEAAVLAIHPLLPNSRPDAEINRHPTGIIKVKAASRVKASGCTASMQMPTITRTICLC